MKRNLARAWLCALVFFGGASCGYRPAYGERRPQERLTVVAAPPKIPRPSAVQAAVAGARARLSRAGVLTSGTAYPRLVIELVRIDEKSSGIQATRDATGARAPLARGSHIAVVGRAWVEPGAGRAPLRDTGDMRRIERRGAAADPVAEAVLHDDAIRAAARRLGSSLAGRVLGEVEPSVEPL